MTIMSREILTCYLDFNLSEELDDSHWFCLAELKSHVDLASEFADLLSKFLVSDLIKSRGAQYFIDSDVDVECLLKGVIAVSLRWRDGVELVDADVLSNELFNMLRDAVEFLVIERYIPDLTYQTDHGADCLYKLDVSGDTTVCQFSSEEMVLLVNKIEGLLVNLNKRDVTIELHVYSELDYFQLPPLESNRHFMDVKDSIEEDIECVAFATEMRGENKAFKITMTGKSRQYYLDDVNREAEDYLARRARHTDKLRLRVRPVRSVKRGVLGPITRYSLVTCLNEKDDGQMMLRFIDEGGRRQINT